MAEPRKHHFLPKFYLQHFADDGRVARLDKESYQVIIASPANLAVIRDFHRLDDESFGDQFQLEKRLGEIEGELSRSLDSVLESGITAEKSHVRLIEFVSLMRMRVPAMKNWIEESLRTVVRSTGNILERHGDLPAPPKGRGNCFGHLDSYNIRTAMHGLEQVHFALPKDRSIRPYATGMSHGPGQRMTATSNTSISAIGALWMTDAKNIHLHVYHNAFAAVPLCVDILAEYPVVQFLSTDSEAGTRQWKRFGA